MGAGNCTKSHVVLGLTSSAKLLMNANANFISSCLLLLLASIERNWDISVKIPEK
jgi:hypothetical protein